MLLAAVRIVLVQNIGLAVIAGLIVFRFDRVIRAWPAWLMMFGLVGLAHAIAAPLSGWFKANISWATRLEDAGAHVVEVDFPVVTKYEGDRAGAPTVRTSEIRGKASSVSLSHQARSGWRERRL